FPEGSVEISVCDTGSGIPKEQMGHIFDRFYQADGTYEHHQKGSGIGLALAKELVELHQGTIEAKSRKGEGSEFIVRLPRGNAHLEPDKIVETITEESPAFEIPMDIGESNNGNETAPETVFDLQLESKTKTDEPNVVLVVEDSADMREYIREALEADYRVVEAEDGKDGVTKAQEIIPDLIVSDVMMPEMNGYELCRQLKTDVQTSHIPVILLTAKASEENIVEGLETGADDYITKPFSTKILSARIKNLIDIRSQLQENFKREMTLQPVRTSVSKIDREFLEELHQVIDKNLSDEDFNVEQLSRKLYVSRATLHRKIVALSGLTPTEFIRSFRLKRAAELLKHHSGSILEVAMEVGFTNSSYFAKCFKEKFHQLPSAYLDSEAK
ncbi:MAG: response regulator, partial [bacterium]|nr:response regulator [bacterium]